MATLSQSSALTEKLAFIRFGSNSPDVDDEPTEEMNKRYFGLQISSSLGNVMADRAPRSESSRLLHQGNAAFRTGQFADAIELYSRLMLITSGQPNLVLSNRCAAFCSLSKHLRLIPAAQSEKTALYGVDPISLAQLALRDADKLTKNLPDWPKALYRKAVALTLMEQYGAARDSLLEALAIDPSNVLLQLGLRQLDADCNLDERMAINPNVSGDSGASLGSDLGSHEWKRKAIDLTSSDDEFDCSLCLKLLYTPVTTPCGHTFCRGCLARALDHSNRCPVCRTVLFVSARSYPVSVTLQNILEKHFAEEYMERKAEVESSAIVGREVLPMFVMDVVLPGQKMALNIFEPRYRLMVRRCMEGDRKMGMVGRDPETLSPADVACEVEICECEPLPDGRFYLEVEGRRRCKIVKSWEQDGYRVGQVEWINDSVPSPGSDDSRDLAAIAEQVSELARSWVSRVQEAARGSRREHLAEDMRLAGAMPPASQPEKLSFWLANLLPLRSNEKLVILKILNTAERLRLEMEYLQNDQSQTCRLQ